MVIRKPSLDYVGYTQQHCQADIVIAPYPDEKIVKLTLSNIGKVFCTTVENDDVVTEEYKELDSTAINLALAGNVKVLIKVDAFTYEVILESNNNKGNDLFIARATGSQPGDYLVDPLKGASVTVTMYGFDHECDYLTCSPALEFDDAWYKDTNSEFVSIDSNHAELTLQHRAPGLTTIKPFHHHTPWAVLSHAAGSKKLFVIEGKRAGSNKLETMVAYIHRICVDGKRIKLRLSKKDLKSKGRAAKKAIDGFTSGVYKIISLYPVLGGSSAQLFPTVAQLQITNGVLTKTAELGKIELEFKPIVSSRVYNIDPDTKMVSSINVNNYLENVAQSISESVNVVVPADFPKPLPTVTMFQEEEGLGYTGFITNLSWTAKGYIATVNLTFHDAKKLGEETTIENFHILFHLIRALPNSPSEIRVWENFDNGNFTAGTNLSGSIFTESTFRFANLTRVNLKNTIFFMATLTNTTFIYANLKNAFLQLADLTRAILTDADLTRADLTRAILTGANLTGANLTRAILTDADLTRAILTDADLTRAILTGANLTGANLTGANLTGANFRGANLQNAIFTNANLLNADFRGANIVGANIVGANIVGADF